MTLHAGRTAVVTGAAEGIGQAIAVRLAADGATVVLVDEQECTDTATRIGAAAVAVIADVSTEQGWQRVSDAVSPAGEVDIVVNNAGIYPFVVIDELPRATWDRIIGTNLTAAYLSVRQFAPAMRRKRWGRFIDISSNSIGTSAPQLAAYMASKMGSIGLVRGIANDLGGDGITANAVLPSLTKTPGTNDVYDQQIQMVLGMQSVKREARPEDVAGLVSFLASDDASFISGQAIAADGGLLKVT